MDFDRLRQWLEVAPTSFDRGVVHEENLRYLLGSQFTPAGAWAQALEAFGCAVCEVQRMEQRLIVRAVVPLTEVPELIPEPIAAEAIPGEVHAHAPPMLVVMPPALAVDHRRFEEYRVALQLDLNGAAATYTVARSLDWPHEGVWTRSVMLEAF